MDLPGGHRDNAYRKKGTRKKESGPEKMRDQGITVLGGHKSGGQRKDDKSV